MYKRYILALISCHIIVNSKDFILTVQMTLCIFVKEVGNDMFTVKENTTLVGVSELRSGIDKILEKTNDGLVIIEKRHKPQAVLMSNKQYEDIQNILDLSEDLILGSIAHERYSNSNEEDYIDIKNLF